MDPRELKTCLYELAKREGKNVLTQDELDYMEGRISYDTYQQRCYAQYCRGKLSNKPPAK
tara:strand:- start:812 stop:991 length:180 start_codon:yes stop_codon:yes gene_type:complete